MPRSARLRPLVFLGSFAATLALFLFFADEPPALAVLDAPPVLEARAPASPRSHVANVPERRVAAPTTEPAADSRPAPTSGFDAGQFEAELRAIAEARPSRRARLLSSKRALLGAGLLQRLLRAGTGEGALEASLARLASEPDPLLQAALLLHVASFEADPRARAALEEATHALLADPSRPVHAQVAVDGLLAAMGRQGVPPSSLVHHVAAHSEDPVILRDLWMALARHGFDFESNRPLLTAGLAHRSPAARFGAAESLRMFALDGALTPEEFVAAFGPIARGEDHRNNRLLFLETLGAVGGDAAVPLLLEVARGSGEDGEARRIAAATLALHAGEDEALAFCREALDGADAAGREAAITALGALPSPAATQTLVDLYSSAGTPEERLRVLRALDGKTDAPVGTFLEAVTAADEELRRAASAHLLLVAEESLPEDERALVEEWRLESARSAADPQVRADAAMSAFLNDDAAGESILEERLARDTSPLVRGSAASTLYLARWARGDATGIARLEDVIANESPAVRHRLRAQLEGIRDRRPAEVRDGLAQQLRMLSFVQSVAPAAPGSKDVFGRQRRLVERLLARMDS